MGQRYQFFAIARINNRYRTLAVVHHQWLYGHRAVRQRLNTMRILAATGNLQGIRRELKLAESKPDGFWEAKPRTRGDDQNHVSFSSHLWKNYMFLGTRLGTWLDASSNTTQHACITYPSSVLLQAQARSANSTRHLKRSLA